MPEQAGRYTPPSGPQLAEGWSLERLTPPSRLFGANGIRTGADGRIYVAQVSGSQVSAIDVDSGAIETVSPMGGDIIGPDDLDFDDAGNLYITEFTEGRVSVLRPDGRAQVVLGDSPGANPITVYRGRLITGECRPGGRIMELDLNGGAPRVILEDVPMPNAMEVGPDGKLYFPVMGTNEIWRVDPEGGTPEVVATDLGVPDAVKFDSAGRIVTTQVGSGEVIRIDLASGEREVLANIAPGLDNLTFVGERLFVSSISGQVNEILPGGELRPLVPDGLNWPLGLAMAEDGTLFVADGGFTYYLKPGGSLQCVGMLFTPGFAGYTRGVAAAGPGEFVVTTANGQVSRWRPAEQEHEVLADGYDRLYGVALGPGGRIVFTEGATGKVLGLAGDRVECLVEGLEEPRGVAFAASGACYVSEEGRGRVVRVDRGSAETVLDGLDRPQGILVRGDWLLVLDAGAQELVALDLRGGERRVLASRLPVGAPAGVTPHLLRGVPPLAGPMVPFAGIAAGDDGTIYLSGDAEGSVLSLRAEDETFFNN